MTKIISKILLILILSVNFSNTNALEITWTETKITISNIIVEKQQTTIWDIFNFLASFYDWQVPQSYKYIKINYKDVLKWSELEDSLKKLIYLDLIKNPTVSINKDREINAWNFYRLSEKILWIQLVDTEIKSVLQNRNATNKDITTIINSIWDKHISINTKSVNNNISQKLDILNDVYDTIIKWHYDKDNLNELDILDSAISWIANWTNDKHTVYFPPIESWNFQDWLSWDYEWIWSYVDMEQPWAVRIVSPIPGSPSEKAWLKWWDLIIKVDKKEVKKENSLSEVITWIKWPAWTTVLLTIDRNWEILEINVVRERIIINDIETEILNENTYYIQIKNFWEHVSNDFRNSLLKLKEQDKIKKIIIDVRNNWWWYLNEVAEILSYFVEEWKNTAIVKYHDDEKNFISRWYDLVDFSKYKIVILQNSWTASASEILIWTLKDYYPDITLIWENTYGKWSVQLMKNYIDGSLLKYTIAKWFTWLTETWIDWVWIKPTIELELDLEKFSKDWFDNQLDKALNIK